MRRLVGLMLLLLTASCGGSTAHLQASPTPHGIAVPSPLPLPSPAANPTYPPVTLADVVALAEKGNERRFLGAEGQALEGCSRGWERIHEPAGVPAQQRSADLVRFALEKQLFTRSCGGLVFGTTNDTNCNCYHGENGYLEVDRGPAEEPAPGKMQIIFEMTEAHISDGDWDITVDAPSA